MDENELDQPAVLMYWPQTEEAAQPGIWQPQRRFPRLRDAILAAMSDMPNDQVPWILTETGVLKPDDIRGIFENLTATPF
ncbi:MAG TPA: hypothetical protein VK434_16175 [Microvirga sp.]|jgi:hypothetical protein|nr:hypothetical protein [Microvirga sp.]